MHIRLAATVATLAITACGCSQQATTAQRQEPGRISVEGKEHPTQTVSCQQVGWLMIIEAQADPGHARVFLQLGGENPSVETVSISNFDGFDGVSAGSGEASAAGGTYTIVGVAEGRDRDSPATSRTVNFRIEAPC